MDSFMKNRRTKALLFVMACLMVLIMAACSGGGGDSTTSGDGTVLSGKFVDAPVEGLEYSTATQGGSTGPDGTFYYRSGETISFNIGKLNFGTAMGDATLTPVHLVSGAATEADPASNPTVVNIVTLLLSLNANTTTTALKIDPSALAKAKTLADSSVVAIDDPNFATKASPFIKLLDPTKDTVSAATAIAHFKPRWQQISGTSTPSSDTTPPELTGLSFFPNSIDTSSSSKSITATISISDNFALPDTGYLNVEVRLRSPSSNQFVDFGPFTGSEEPGSTIANRTFKITCSISQGSESGIWKVQYVHITDKVGNSIFLTADNVSALGFANSINNISTFVDTTPPELTGLSFSPNSIDTSSSSKSITATISISDNFALPDAMYRNVEVRLRSPSNNQFVDFGAFTDSEEPGSTITNRTFKITSSFSQGRESGIWKLEYVHLIDKVGNSIRLSADNVSALGFANSIENTSTFSDTTTPELTGLSFSPGSIDTSSSSKSITATVSISDNFSLPGTMYRNVEVRLRSPSNNQFVDFGAFTDSEEPGSRITNRTFKITSSFSQGRESGIWKVEYVYLIDKVGNSIFLTADNVSALGFANSIIVQ